ncbi:MAG: DUF3300 domain-containing protein [Deltaproteobacteria bacterium]|nr:DUF3300 domain-containing protein [Deltaproteobacteria bacterium]
MKKIGSSIRVLTWLLMVMLVVPVVASGQAAPPPVYSKAELAQMVAPVALYPDALLIQVLMAATYPVEVQEAAVWVAQNPTLQGAQLDTALLAVGWDVSVKSLAHVPNILQMMNEKIEWTSALGNAFLVQQGEVMDTVQELRVKAQAAGYLKTTAQQKVIVEERIVRIEPPAPDVVYVPVYNPVVVYGPWMYPAYPPPPVVYVSPGVPVVAGVVGFTAGFMVGAAVNSWVTPHWGRHYVDINVSRTVHYNVVTVHDRGGRWEHNPSHRLGVPYHNPDTARRFNGKYDPHPAPFKPVHTGYTPGGKTGPTGFTPGGKTGSTGFTPGGKTGPTGFTPGGKTGSTGSTPGGKTGPTGFTPGGKTGSTGSTPGGKTGPTGFTPGGKTGSTGSTPGGKSGSMGFTPGGKTGTTKSISTQTNRPSGSTTSRSFQSNRPSGSTTSRSTQMNRPSSATTSRSFQSNRPSGATMSKPASQPSVYRAPQPGRSAGAAAPKSAPPRSAPQGHGGKDPKKH